MDSVLQFHSLAHARHGLAGDGTGAARPFDENLAQLTRLGKRRGATFSDRIEQRVDRHGQLRLHLDVAG